LSGIYTTNDHLMIDGEPMSARTAKIPAEIRSI